MRFLHAGSTCHGRWTGQNALGRSAGGYLVLLLRKYCGRKRQRWPENGASLSAKRRCVATALGYRRSRRMALPRFPAVYGAALRASLCSELDLFDVPAGCCPTCHRLVLGVISVLLLCRRRTVARYSGEHVWTLLRSLVRVSECRDSDGRAVATRLFCCCGKLWHYGGRWAVDRTRNGRTL
ncbi:hypothetical protein NPIL_609061 [Nephila pilipes]|uniref:Uncharacterized protein n=1 Tax=Nephila pilipes TaxID=299642 RepID=A0A8X6PZ56_NEPPI|nr:hypothetical protein NPIL_609061 [Nephila pilipes]